MTMTQHQVITAAGGGTSITAATKQFLPVPRISGHGKLTVTAHTLAGGAEVVLYSLNPRLVILHANVPVPVFTDASNNLQDASTATSLALTALKTLGKGGAIYVGVPSVVIGGVRADVGTVNAVVSTLGAHFWNGSAWAAVAGFADGSASGGAPFAVDGSITWTVPTTAAVEQLANILALKQTDYSPDLWHFLSREMFWFRLSHTNATDAPLTSPSTLLQLLSITGLAATGEAFNILPQTTEITTEPEPGGVGCVQLDCDAGTAKVIIELAAYNFI